jgi:steroid 5-alpha reductase family enzyme
MQLKHAINLPKGLTAIVVVGLMTIYQNFTLGAWVYLALHGTYGILWLIKDRIYPDKQWEQETTLGMGLITVVILGLYWVAPFLLIRSGVVPPLPLVAGAIACNIVGVFLHYTSDAQKYYTLKYHPGLITEGFFANCRNTNYLGEILIYGSFALLSCHWLPWLILAAFVAVIFVPNMRKKDQSLSRYPEFARYQAQSGLVFPKLLGAREPVSDSAINPRSPSEL